VTAKAHGLRFHLAGGLVFQRSSGESGEDVIEIGVVRRADGGPQFDPLDRSLPYEKLAVTSLSGFASVIAHLGYEGETYETHLRALAALEGAGGRSAAELAKLGGAS